MPHPRHAEIAAALRDEILSGALPAGSAVASEADLAERFSVSRGTVRQALASLRGDGLIAGGRGRRPVVNRPALSQSFDQMVSFTVWAERAGHLPGAHTLELTRRPADAATATALELEPGTPVFQYKRLRLLDREPAMIEASTFIERVGRLLLDFDLDSGSVYEQLDQRGVTFAETEQTISATAATGEQATLLAVPRRSPLLAVRRRVFDPAGTPVELSTDTYRGDSFTISLHNRVTVSRAGVSLTVSGD